MKLNYRKTAVVCALGAAITVCAAAVVPAAETDSAAAVESVVEEAVAVESVVEEAAAVESVAEEVEEAKRPEYNVADFVTLGEYKGLTLEVDPIEITDEDVDAKISSTLRTSDAASDVLTEGTVENGDIANIDYEGKKDDVPFDGGSSQGYDLEIGSGTFIPGFEEGLEGAEIGSTVDLNLTFPENYGNAELAGQDVVFTVTVNSVKRIKELDDELASVLSEGEATTVADYREWTKGGLAEDARIARDEQAKNDLLEMAAANLTVSEYPQDLVDYTVEDIRNYFTSYASMYGVDLGTFLNGMFGMSEEDFPAEAEKMAKTNLDAEFAVRAIADAENLLPEGDDLTAAYDETAMKYGFTDGESFLEQYGAFTVDYVIEEEKVRDFLFDNAVIVERVAEADSMAEDVTSAVSSAANVEDIAE